MSYPELIHPDEEYKPSDFAPHKLRATLSARFPLCFVPVGVRPKPLKIGIYEDLLIAFPECPAVRLHGFFGSYCDRIGYLLAITRSAHRVDLDGNPCGEITEEQKKNAAARLKRLREIL